METIAPPRAVGMAMLGIMFTPRLFLTLFAMALLNVGCQTQPEVEHELAAASDIRAKIVGAWSKDTPQRSSLTTVSFNADGTVLSQRAGRADVHLNWRVDNSCLIVTLEKNGFPPTSDGYWTVWHIDDHELLFRPGFSTAGPPERFTR